MISWDEYEIHLIEKWFEKNDLHLLKRGNRHYDIQRNDLLIFLKDDLLYRGNWKNGKSKYSELFTKYIHWEEIFIASWVGLARLADWINALCTLRNHVKIDGLTEFQLNDCYFTIWGFHEEIWFCFDIIKNRAGYKKNWNDEIEWRDLPKPQEETYSVFIQQHQDPLPQLILPLFTEDKTIFEPIEEEKEEKEEKVKPIKINWNYYKIKQWLLKGCPKIVEPKQLEPPPISSIEQIPEEPVNTEIVKPFPRIYDNQIKHHMIKKDFLKRYWTIVEWGRENQHQIITQIIN